VKKLILIFCTVLSFSLVNAQPMIEPLTGQFKPTSDEVYTIVDEAPQFPGGQDELNKFLIKNIKYPVMARECECRGRVFVSFVIDKDGTVIDVKIARKANSCSTTTCYDAAKNIVPCNSPNKASETVDCDASGMLDKEAIRVIKIMPKWIPGKLAGKPVRVQYILPVKFTLR
jgi:protein TonB